MTSELSVIQTTVLSEKKKLSSGSKSITTPLQIKPDEFMKDILRFLALEAGGLLGHISISSSSEISLMVEEFIMSKA